MRETVQISTKEVGETGQTNCAMPSPTLFYYMTALWLGEREESPDPSASPGSMSSPLLALLDMPPGLGQGRLMADSCGLSEGSTEWGFWEMTLQMLCKTKMPLSRLNTNERMLGWNTGCCNSSAMNSQDPSSQLHFKMSYICCKDAKPKPAHWPGSGEPSAGGRTRPCHEPHATGKVVVALGYSATLSKMDPFLHVGIMPFLSYQKK